VCQKSFRKTPCEKACQALGGVFEGNPRPTRTIRCRTQQSHSKVPHPTHRTPRLAMNRGYHTPTRTIGDRTPTAQSPSPVPAAVHPAPRTSPSSSSFILSSLELSDTTVHEPYIRALLDTVSQFCEAIVLRLLTHSAEGSSCQKVAPKLLLGA